MEIAPEAPREEPQPLFSAAFWLRCEREAATMVHVLTGVDDV